MISFDLSEKKNADCKNCAIGKSKSKHQKRVSCQVSTCSILWHFFLLSNCIYFLSAFFHVLIFSGISTLSFSSIDNTNDYPFLHSSTQYSLNYIKFLHNFLPSFGVGVQACVIAGADTGWCDPELYESEPYRRGQMGFCADLVSGYIPCVPKEQALPPTREFPLGRFLNHSTYLKDQWVEEMYKEVVRTREGYEASKVLKKAGVDENGLVGKVYPRFKKHKDCYDAYKAYMCWANFPRCDDRGRSLPMCTSVCLNFFKACGYELDMVRCGPSEYFNGYEPEKPHPETKQYLRDFMPGQPFRENEFTKKRQPGIPRNTPIPVCTPSIKNSGAVVKPNPWTFAMGSLITILIGFSTFASFF